MIIKIDVDGVIRNIYDTMCRIYNRDFKENMSVDDIVVYDVDKVFTKVREKLHISASEYFFKFNSRDLFLLSKPYCNVRECIKKLMDDGHKVIIATWQYTLLNKVDTLYFLELNQIPYDDICFTKDKWMIKANWIIDDNPEFICNEKENARKILINMPYNQNIDYNGLRANNLNEAIKLILKENIND